ncbi:hypothetical protein DFJ73DRAFT_776268 [Zopfochytrium polystomum]|nr:hypothetical protein DFJ73DRAFT_776268 [Zopfochytrium polystomum]
MSSLSGSLAACNTGRANHLAPTTPTLRQFASAARRMCPARALLHSSTVPHINYHPRSSPKYDRASPPSSSALAPGGSPEGRNARDARLARRRKSAASLDSLDFSNRPDPDSLGPLANHALIAASSAQSAVWYTTDHPLTTA